MEPAVRSGAGAGIAALAVFLVLHHLWIAPIWFVAPMGAAIAALGGAAVGAAYGELEPHLPRRSLRAPAVLLVSGVVLAPAFVLAAARGPVYAFGADGRSILIVPAADAVTAFFAGLLVPTVAAGALVGALVGRTARAAWLSALAGLGLALGPGHNIPLLGGPPAATTELAILAASLGVASVVLTEGTSRAARSLATA